MQKHFKNTLFLVLLFVLCYFFWSGIIGVAALDMQVVDWPQWVLLVFAPATFVYFLVRAISDRFKSAGINMGLLLTLLFISYLIFVILQIMDFIFIISSYPAWLLYSGWVLLSGFMLASVFLACTIYLQWRNKYSTEKGR